MKIDTKHIADFLAKQRLLITGIDDYIKVGDDGWKEAVSNHINEILKAQDEFIAVMLTERKEKESDVKVRGIRFEAGSVGERLYSFFIRQYKAIPIDKLYLPDQDLKYIVEDNLRSTEGVLKQSAEMFFYTFMEAMDKAFDDIIPERRKKEKQSELF